MKESRFSTLLKKVAVIGLCGILIGLHSFAQKGKKFFPAKELTTVGVYYYPEHWDSTQ